MVQEAHFTEHFQTPPRLDLLDLQRYDKAGFGIGVVNKLAPYYYATEDGQSKSAAENWRIRPAADVVEEVRRLQRDFGIRKVFFIDSGFNIPLPQAKALCQALLQANVRIRWNSYLQPGEGDAELIELMRRSGCSLALITGTGGMGAHPPSSRPTRATGKTDQLVPPERLPLPLSMNFGDPGETRATVEQKLAFLRQATPAFATLRVGTRVLPHTSLANRRSQKA